MSFVDAIVSPRMALAGVVLKLVTRAIDKNESKLVEYVHHKLAGRFPGIAATGTADELQDVVDHAQALLAACKAYLNS